MEVKCFEAMDVDGMNLSIFDCSRFERDTALRARKRRWALLSEWSARNLVETCFVNMSLLAVASSCHTVADSMTL